MTSKIIAERHHAPFEGIRQQDEAVGDLQSCGKAIVG